MPSRPNAKANTGPSPPPPAAAAAALVLAALTACDREPDADGPLDQQTVRRAPGAGEADTPASGSSAESIIKARTELDGSVWKLEVAAQAHERVITEFWDQLRSVSNPFAVLTGIPFEKITLATPTGREEIGDGIGITRFRPPFQHLDGDAWRVFVDARRDAGYRIEGSEWRHVEFTPPSTSRGAIVGASSRVRFRLHVARDQPAHRAAISGTLLIKWQAGVTPPRPGVISALEIQVVDRASPAAFETVLRASTDAAHTRLMPLLVRDLDGDGLPEVAAGGLNKIWRNRGGGKFQEEPLVLDGLDIFDAAIIADFTGDGRGDLVAVSADRRPRIWPGDANGRFTQPSRTCSHVTLDFPKAFTAGDIDGDGDLDLFIGQYKFPYSGGSMPTPFHDSRDGHPCALLRNEGAGRFSDYTGAARLNTKRKRRTYSASFVDADGDGDLDLLTVNDFAGLDLWENMGDGKFTDATENTFDRRLLFGTAHAFADFDADGRTDLFAVGRNSDTVARLDALGLTREERPEVASNRLEMTFGGLLLLREGSRFVPHPAAAEVADVGWAWGTSAADFDLDGTPEIYVGNGRSSGRSAKDYGTRFWRHDVYSGDSDGDSELARVFNASLKELNEGEISWHGHERNRLWRRAGGGGFIDIAHLYGLAIGKDSRGVVATDLDADGLPDLAVVTVRQEGGGKNHYTLQVLRNTLQLPDRHWIGVRLKPSSDGRSPLGATVVARSGNAVQAKPVVTGDSFSSQHPLVAHFGLGQNATPAEVEIRWPDGERSVLKNLGLDRYHDIARP